jgi:hypothetical protein
MKHQRHFDTSAAAHREAAQIRGDFVKYTAIE